MTMEAQPLPDDALVAEAARGDRAAFEELVRRHSGSVWAMANYRLGDPGEAEDVAQDTFLRVYRSLGTFRGEASVRTWIHAICRNLCVDRLRSRHADVISLDQMQAGGSPAAGFGSDPESQAVTRAALARAVERLPDDEREAFLLVDALAFTAEEAARSCGVPATTLRSRLSRAHRKLVAQMQER